MNNLSHTTINSFPGRAGHCYWINFDPKRTEIGRTTNVYKGRFNGKGPLIGEFATVKTTRGQTGTSTWCDVQIRKNRKAYELADQFHKRLDSKNTISFTDSWKVLMDKKARFSSGISDDEWLVFEEFLGSDLHCFVDPEGKVNYGNCDILEAFVHWTYVASDGYLVVSNLEGAMSPMSTANNSTFNLKTPTIHSMDQIYGFSDKGLAGIAEVLHNHQCNDICMKVHNPTRNSSRMLYKSDIHVSNGYYSVYSDLPPSYYYAVS